MSQDRSLVDVNTGEVVEPMSLDDARLVTGHIRNLIASVQEKIDKIAELLAAAYERRAWLALGYESWDAYVSAELRTDRLRLDRDDRQELVVQLRSAGMSTRAIGSALGVGKSTVDRDLDESTVPTGTVDEPQSVTSLDGRQRPATQPPRPQPSSDMPPPVALDPEPEPWSQDEIDMRQDLEDGATVVVSLRGHHARLIEWAMQRGLYVRVDRATPWGNPFETPADGERGVVVAHYGHYYLPHKPSLLNRLAELKGKALGCWCAPLACHADVLRARADAC